MFVPLIPNSYILTEAGDCLSTSDFFILDSILYSKLSGKKVLDRNDKKIYCGMANNLENKSSALHRITNELKKIKESHNDNQAT